MYKNSAFLLLLLMVIPLYSMEEEKVECMQIATTNPLTIDSIPDETLLHILEYVIPHYFMMNYSTAKDVHHAIVKVLMTYKRFYYLVPSFKKQLVAALYNKHVPRAYIAPRKLNDGIDDPDEFDKAEKTLHDAIKFIFMVPKFLKKMAYENLKQWIGRSLSYEPDRQADSTYGFELAEEIDRLARINDANLLRKIDFIVQLDDYAQELASEQLAFEYWNRPLIWLVETNNFAAIKLLAKKIDVNKVDQEDDLIPLWVAIYSVNYEMVQFLVSLGAGVNMRNEKGDASLHMAIGQIGVAQSKGGSESHMYTSEELLPIIEFLIDKGADVDMRNKDGDTPLHIAAEAVIADVVFLLLERGANPNIGDEDGDTPLHRIINLIATPQIDKEASYLIINYLVGSMLHRGVNFNSANGDGDTPLHRAVCSEDFTVVKFLIDKLQDKKTDINVQNNDGDTPLHMAVGTVIAEDVVSLLLENGADSYRVNNDGKTAFDLAQEENDDTVIQILEAWKSSDSQPIKKLKTGH